MSEARTPLDAPLPLSLAQILDPVCDQFEAAWRAAGTAGPRPRIEDSLGAVPSPERAALLRELILLDIYYRRRAGEYPKADDYRDRFPELEGKWLADAITAQVSGSSEAVMQSALRPAEGEDLDISVAGIADAERGIPRRIGEFRILRKIGAGGMGVVYEAVQEPLGRHVALKILPLNPLAGSVPLERFRREARAAAKLHHTNIVPVFGVGVQAGVHYYAMQFIEGRGLDRVLHEVRLLRSAHGAAAPSGSDLAFQMAKHLTFDRFAYNSSRELEPICQAAPQAVCGLVPPPTGKLAHPEGRGAIVAGSADPSDLSNRSETAYFRKVARVGVQVAEALEYAHRQGILHRDIKPSNLLLDAAGTVWVTDFGLAKAEGTDGLTHSGDIVGTLPYMAPERFQGRSDPRSDIYSLGLTLYELLTLRPAFADSDRARLIYRLQSEYPPAPRKVDHRIPRDLDTVVRKAIAKDPQLRYTTAEELAEDLRRFLADRPIRARRTPLSERAWRWCRRNPVVASLIAFVLGVVVLSLVLVTWQWQAAVAARRITAENLYFHIIARAARELALENWGPAEDLLEQCEEGRRGWEWHYLKRLRQKAPVVVPFGDRSWIAEGFDLAFHPNSRLLAIPNADGTIRIWDAVTGRETLTLRGHTGPVLSVAFSPDGRHLASASDDRTVRMWDAAIGQERLCLKGHKDQVIGVVFSPDQGRLVASASNDRTVKVWNAETGELVFDFIGQSTPNPPMQPAFSPGGRRLAAGSAGHTVKVWDVRTGEELYTLTGNTQPVSNVIFSADGRRLVSAGRDRAFNVWQLPSGEPAVSAPPGRVLAPWFTLPQLARAAWGMALSPNGRRLAVGGPYSDGSVRVYELTTRELVLRLTGDVRIISVAFSPDGKRLASAGHDKTIRLWDTMTGHEILALRGHTDYIGRLLFSPNGQRLVSASGDGTVRVWDANTFDQDGDPRIVTLRGHSGEVYSLAFSPQVHSHPRLASASADQLVKIWDIRTREESLVLRGHQGGVMTVAFSPDGQRLLSGSADETAILWDLVSGERLRQFEDFGSHVIGVAFSPNGETFAAGTVNTLQFWEARTGRRLSSARDAGVGYPGRMTFTADGKLVATVDANSTVRVWDVATSKQVRAFPIRSPKLSTPSFSRDGRLLACGQSDGSVKIWDFLTGLEQHTLSGHTDSVYCTAFSPDGRSLATASWREIIIWDTNRFERIQTLSRLPGRIWSIAFSPDGRCLAGAGGYKGKGEIRIWDASLWENRAAGR